MAIMLMAIAVIACVTLIAVGLSKANAGTPAEVAEEFDRACGDVWCEMDWWWHFYPEGGRVTVVRVPHCEMGNPDNCDRGRVFWRSCPPARQAVIECITGLGELP